MAVNKQMIEAFRQDLDAALKQLAAKHGLASLKPGSISYRPEQGNFSFSVTGVAEGGKTKTEMQYDRWQKILGLPARGSDLVHDGVSYQTVGMNESKNLLVRRSIDGKVFTLRLQEALKVLGKKEGVS
jgi:hypothetical protein